MGLRYECKQKNNFKILKKNPGDCIYHIGITVILKIGDPEAPKE